MTGKEDLGRRGSRFDRPGWISSRPGAGIIIDLQGYSVLWGMVEGTFRNRFPTTPSRGLGLLSKLPSHDPLER